MTVLNELAMRPTMAGRWGWDASVRTRLVLSGVAIAVLLIGANLATPLYPLLQAGMGLTALDVTVAFAAYVLSLVTGLLLVGHWSDHIGRRAALTVSLVVALAGGLIFAGAQDLAALAAGRALQGAAVALATGASSAALRELLPAHPEWASLFTLLVSAGGVAAGPAIGGVLSMLPDPTRTPFLLHSLVLIALLVPLLLIRARPAIRPAPQGHAAAALRPRKPTVSRQARGQFWMAALVGFASFAVFGFFLSLAPTYFAGIAGTGSRPIIGLLAALVLASSAISQLLTVRGKYVVPAGLTGMAVSLLLVAAAGAIDSLPLLIGASVTAGLCQGAAFRVAFSDVANRTEPGRHAQVISTVYVITYLGSAVPVIGLGAAAEIWGLPAAVAGFAVVIAAMAVALAGAALRQVLKSSPARRETTPS